MDAEFNELKSLWTDAKKTAVPTVTNDALIARARAKKTASLYAHYGNIIVLTCVLAIVCVFFYYLFPFRQGLSQAGVHLMAAGLVVRIIIEIASIKKFQLINLTDHTSKAMSDSLAFYTFRKYIHGPVTIAIVAMYLLGFFMLAPEISSYTGLPWVIVLEGVSISAAVVLIRVISKGIHEEMLGLWELIEIRKKLTEQE